MCGNSFSTSFNQALNDLPLSAAQKKIINLRYIKLVQSSEVKYIIMRSLNAILMFVIILAGVLVTAFSSIGNGVNSSNVTNNNSTYAFWWVLWALGILISAGSSILAAFSIPEKYVDARAVMEKLQSEGWIFISNIGEYVQFPEYDQKFTHFCSRIEKINMVALESSPDMRKSDGAADILAAGHNIDTRSINIIEEYKIDV